MCLLRNILEAVRRLRQMYFRGFTIVLHRRAAMTILSLLMIVTLLMCWTVAPLLSCRALLTEVTLIGGGDLTLSALLDFLMVAFGAAGMDGAVRNQSAATGTQPVPYIGQLLNRYLEVALNGILPSVWSKRIADGLTILANGTLYLDSDATAAVADFQRWAWSEDGGNLLSYAPVAAGDDYTTVQGFDCALVTTAEISPQSATRRYGSYVLKNATYTYGGWWDYAVGSESPGAQYFVCLANKTSTSVDLCVAPVNAYSAKTWMSYVSNGVTYFSDFGTKELAQNAWTRLYSIGFGDSVEFLVPVTDVDVAGLSFSADDLISSGDVIGDVNTFVGPMLVGQGTQLPLGDVAAVSTDNAVTMHLLNYLRALAAGYAGDGTATVPVIDVDTGEDELLPLTVPLDTPIGVTGVTDTAIDESGSETGTDSIAGNFQGTNEYTMDLTQFFPFCIPFDIVALYQKFEAEAEAPVVDWPIPIPGQEEPYLLHLDFSAFDTLAVWVRRLELIAFAVGLMVMTKRLIQGGD